MISDYSPCITRLRRTSGWMPERPCPSDAPLTAHLPWIWGSPSAPHASPPRDPDPSLGQQPEHQRAGARGFPQPHQEPVWFRGSNRVTRLCPRCLPAAPEWVLSMPHTVRGGSVCADTPTMGQYSPAGSSPRDPSSFPCSAVSSSLHHGGEESREGGSYASRIASTERAAGARAPRVTAMTEPQPLGSACPRWRHSLQPWGHGWTHGAENVPKGAEPGRQRSHGIHQNTWGPATMSTEGRTCRRRPGPPHLGKPLLTALCVCVRTRVYMMCMCVHVCVCAWGRVPMWEVCMSVHLCVHAHVCTCI